MMHKARRGIGALFSQGHPSNFKGTQATELAIWHRLSIQVYLAGRSYHIHEICLVLIRDHIWATTMVDSIDFI